MIQNLRKWAGSILWNILIGHKGEAVQLDSENDYIFVFEDDLSTDEYEILTSMIGQIVSGEFIIIGGAKPVILGFTNENNNK